MFDTTQDTLGEKLNPFVNDHNGVIRWLREVDPEDVLEACLSFTATEVKKAKTEILVAVRDVEEKTRMVIGGEFQREHDLEVTWFNAGRKACIQAVKEMI